MNNNSYPPIESIKATLWKFEDTFIHTKKIIPVSIPRARGEIESSLEIYNHSCFEKSIILAQRLLEKNIKVKGKLIGIPRIPYKIAIMLELGPKKNPYYLTTGTSNYVITDHYSKKADKVITTKSLSEITENDTWPKLFGLENWESLRHEFPKYNHFIYSLVASLENITRDFRKKNISLRKSIENLSLETI